MSDADSGGAAAALVRRHGVKLLRLASRSIEHGLRAGRALPVLTAGHHPDLARDGASFVTLDRDGQLRGCIGSPEACRPLAVDVAENAYAAAFLDPRFPPLQADELPQIELSVSVLGAPDPVSFGSEADLLQQLRPGTDGLIIEAGPHRALFLPAVWHSLPEPADFLAHLKAKAGLPPAGTSQRLEAWTFVAAEISERQVDESIWTGGSRS